MYMNLWKAYRGIVGSNTIVTGERELSAAAKA
jgi:hypothetical protein